MTIRLPYDSLTLRAVTDALRRALPGGTVQHIAQPVPTDLVLTVRNQGANHALLLSCDPTFARAHLTRVKRSNPPHPPPFCMLCRKYVEGARVVDVRQRDFDRILDIDLDGSDGVGYRLTVELMGKHSNLLLIHENGVILDAAKRITRKLSRHRETLPGRPYLPPPSQEEKADPFATTLEDIAEFAATLPDEPEAQAARWMGRFAGLSPFLAQELAQRGQLGSPEGAWEEIFGAAKAGRWMPIILRDARAETVGAYPFPTVQADPELQYERESINTALDHYYSTALPRAALDAARRELDSALEHALRARERQRDSLLRSLEEAGRAEQYKQGGELLLAHLHLVEPEAESVTVADFYAPDGGPRTLALDPRKSPRENADAYFRRYRKAKDGAEMQRAQLARTEDDVGALREARERVSAEKELPALRALRTSLTRQGLLRAEKGSEGETEGAKRGPDFQGKKIRVFTTPEGWDIYVGENSEANDYLTGKVAAPNDLWLHVRANTSAHVVIRTRNSPGTVPQSVLQRAARLAARHSAAKHSALVPVDYTLKKYVRRPRGAASGTAVYQNEKTIYVDPQAG